MATPFRRRCTFGGVTAGTDCDDQDPNAGPFDFDGDGFSACDGDYDKKEIRIIKKIAKIAGVDNDALSEIYQWVEDYWSVYKRSNDFLR